MLGPFLGILGIMTFVLLLGKILQLMDLMVNKGIKFSDIASLILFLMPYFLLFTIPISLLLAILTGMGRLASDNEIVALKGAGISLYRLLYPIGGVSIIGFLITLSLSLYFVPYCNYATKDILFSIVRQNASSGIKEKVFNDDFKGILLYANHIPADGKFMEGVFVSDSREDREPSTIFADRAYLVSDPESKMVSLRLTNGSTHTFDMKRKSYQEMNFAFYDINLDLGASLAETKRNTAKSSTEMTSTELLTKIRTSATKSADRRELVAELNERFTLPLTCLIFCLFGLPIGIRSRRAAKARGLTIGMIIVLSYYVTQLGGTALAETGKIPPWLGLWFPSVLFTLIGIYVLVKTANEDIIGFQPSSSLMRIHGRRLFRRQQ